MWHDDNWENWQPYADHDGSLANSTWRHHRQHVMNLQNASLGSIMGPSLRPASYHYNRHIVPFARLQPPLLLPGTNSTIPTLTVASYELSWRNVNNGWVLPQSRLCNGNWPGILINSELSKPILEITTPHAGGDLRARPIPIKRAANENKNEFLNNIDEDSPPIKRALYSDFSAPTQPKNIKIKYEESALKITIFWVIPDLPTIYKYKQKIEVRDNLTIIEEDTLAYNTTSFQFKTTPGCEYNIKLKIINANGEILAFGLVEKCKAMFSLEEIDKLLTRALEFTGSAMQAFSLLYRCKPKIYWDDIYFRTNGIMERYMKDNNGQAASPINGNISGLFFSAKTLPDGSLPPSSPFGDIRMIIPAITLLDPTRVTFFFCDFYCNRIIHYVTIVVCEKGSQTEQFCKEKLKHLNIKDNHFLRITSTNNPAMPYIFYVNKSVWVEIYYTENIPMHWGRFDHITATGAGTSKIGGLPHNKSCLTCNLYPISPQSDIYFEPVEDLVAAYENENESIFPRNTTRYTALGCVQAEILTPSSTINSKITKDEYLEIAECVIYCVDYAVLHQNYETLKKFNFVDKEWISKENIKDFKYLFDEEKNLFKLNYNSENKEISPLITTKRENNNVKLDKVVNLSIDHKKLVNLKNLQSSNFSITNYDKTTTRDVTFVDTILTEFEKKKVGFFNCNKSSEVEEKDALHLSSPTSKKLAKILNQISNNVKSVPVVTNLILKLKVLIKEMDRGFTELNTDIDLILGKSDKIIEISNDNSTSTINTNKKV